MKRPSALRPSRGNQGGGRTPGSQGRAFREDDERLDPPSGVSMETVPAVGRRVEGGLLSEACGYVSIACESPAGLVEATHMVLERVCATGRRPSGASGVGAPNVHSLSSGGPPAR